MADWIGDDPLLDEAIATVRRVGRAQVSTLQREMRIGYTRSGLILKELERRGIVTEPDKYGIRRVV